MMLLPRLPVLSALLVLLLAAGRCTAAALLRGSGTRADGGLEGRSMLELVGRYPRRTETAGGLTGHGVRTPDRDGRSQQGPEGHPRDPQHKDKFLHHLTGTSASSHLQTRSCSLGANCAGPLYFNPKCRKHFYRLYHNTRDCTIPAYYKRCARLLIRLANSPRCMER
ncbi:ALK and LTK ligand 2-like isoform X1 [Siniperca chuatsi]|uniref:ALK and LTK ligand 2-like isoform X1 n=1 Tax=Siniperca chuatsi TaxID=119488 RepID=UPI001CE0B052|nr:ALK and LTK ligand 2-like isoform X1 [Siniperca chuatsi]XP_044043584.1 ALK and LTK ligand 2-like isoform X1 [Siniperca chuatsi]